MVKGLPGSAASVSTSTPRIVILLSRFALIASFSVGACDRMFRRADLRSSSDGTSGVCSTHAATWKTRSAASAPLRIPIMRWIYSRCRVIARKLHEKVVGGRGSRPQGGRGRLLAIGGQGEGGADQ